MAVAIICASIFSFNAAQARAVIYVINSGQTMNVSDPFHEIPDSVIWSAENLSADDEFGIIAFDEIPRVVRPLSKIADNPVISFPINYRGNHNASAALLTAVDTLSQKFDVEKTIIFFTDGENLLDNAAQNQMFAENVKAALKQAEWLGIPVYIISLRADVNPQNYHSYEWAKEIPINYRDLMTTVRTITHNDFKTPHIQILSENFPGRDLTFEVPIADADKLKILLLSSSAGTAQLQNFTNAPAINNSYVKVFNVAAPNSNKFSMAIDYPQGTGLTLDVIPTIKGTINAQVEQPLFTENILQITPMYKNLLDRKLLEDKFFEGKELHLQINDKEFLGKVSNGVIEVKLDGVGHNISLQKIHFEELGIIFDGDDTAQLTNPASRIAWFIALAAILVILALLFRTQKKNPQPLKNLLVNTASAKNFSYHGLLKIRTSDDATTREFNIFRVADEQISLSQILENCSIDNFEPFAGIIVKPAPQGIIIENNSPCTITYQNDLIPPDKSLNLEYGDSIVIMPEYGNFSLNLTFESLKPN